MPSYLAVLRSGLRPRPEPPMASSPHLTISVTRDRHGDPVLVLAGDLDVASRDDLATALARLFECRWPQAVTLDLAGVGFVDCSSLAVLIWAHQQLSARNGGLICTGAQPVVRRIVRLTGLDGYLDLREGREAVASAGPADAAARDQQPARDSGPVMFPAVEDSGGIGLAAT